jgi:phosphopantothenoylcysteine synthetase/decarboxylase
MHCIVTAGPTCETLDRVRRLTNFSTGKLGAGLADYLAARGHRVTLLLSEQATHRGKSHANRVQTFTTTADLSERLRALAAEPVDAVFHAAAVSDFKFGKIWQRSAQGELSEIESGKISSRQDALLAELVPTPKIIAELRGWFPKARLVGWKFEVDGDRAGVLRAAQEQLAENFTDACVANGLAYGDGFGLVTGGRPARHLAGRIALYAALEKLLHR